MFISNNDHDSVKWDLLKNIIKHKIEQNVSMFLRTTTPPLPTPSFGGPIRMPNGGVKLPPFPPRQQSNINMIEAPPSYMDEEQAKAMKDSIFAQLDTFDSDPPFTIQRVCELCIEPKKHYNSIGKYLRAVEKSILVTSTSTEFPPLTDQEKGSNVPSKVAANQPLSIPNTPLFSPIPFLHNDARRSKSRSPPPSPLALSSAGPVNGGHPEPLSLEPQALGLVDELDDPGPGHMSEHPTALSVVTTVDDGKEGKPIVQSLESRFVKAEDDDTAMAVDENKENQST
ncbi:PPP4R2-domain-containing protein [Lentinula aff. detonsa]|nr:PPP4R2-domain-containing protein [Lentinula aff. detonsa]